MKEDRILLSRALRGDADAFRSLYDRYAPAVYGYALRLTAQRHNAEDVTQDVFLALLKRGKSYDPSRPFLPWVLGITRHEAINHLRRRKRVERSVDRELMETAPAPSGDPDAAEFIEEALIKVPPVFREALWLCDGMGMSYDESARIMGCDPGTVGSRLSRGRKLLLQQVARKRYAV